MLAAVAAAGVCVQAGIAGGWEARGPPHKQRYLSFPPAQAQAQGSGAASKGKANGVHSQEPGAGECRAVGELLSQVSVGGVVMVGAWQALLLCAPCLRCFMLCALYRTRAHQ